MKGQKYMVKIVEGEEYLSAGEAAQVLGISIARFYTNARKYLRVYRFDAKKVKWYNKNQVLAMKLGKPIRKASIAITGMFSDWTEHARSLGFNIQSADRETVIETLPQELKETFYVSTDVHFVRKTQMSWVDGLPICAWSTWYPVVLVQDILPQILDGSAHDVIGHIAERHGIVIREVSDVYSGRITTFEEQTLFQLLNDEPLLVLQRMARTEDKQVVVLYQDMQLLSSWFIVRRTENIHYWDK
jgi:UTRA domain